MARRLFRKKYANSVPIENETSVKKPKSVMGESGGTMFTYAESAIMPVIPAKRRKGLRGFDCRSIYLL
jgi:hypothetical protein